MAGCVHSPPVVTDDQHRVESKDLGCYIVCALYQRDAVESGELLARAETSCSSRCKHDTEHGLFI